MYFIFSWLQMYRYQNGQHSFNDIECSSGVLNEPGTYVSGKLWSQVSNRHLCEVVVRHYFFLFRQLHQQNTVWSNILMAHNFADKRTVISCLSNCRMFSFLYFIMPMKWRASDFFFQFYTIYFFWSPLCTHHIVYLSTIWSKVLVHKHLKRWNSTVKYPFTKVEWSKFLWQNVWWNTSYYWVWIPHVLFVLWNVLLIHGSLSWGKIHLGYLYLKIQPEISLR